MFFQEMYGNRKLSTKFVFWFLVVSLVPLGIFGYLNYYTTKDTLEQQILTNLTIAVEERVGQIERYVAEDIDDVARIAHIPTIIDYVEQFTSVVAAKGFGSPEYAAVDEACRPYLLTLTEHAGYYDLFLISPSGDIVFTVDHEDDFGTNLVTGPYKETELAHAFSAVTTSMESGISHFKYYAPSDEPAAFVAAPILRGETLVGVAAIQLDTELIYELAQNYVGLGETGEVIIATVDEGGDNALLVTPVRHDPDAAFKREIALGSERGLPMQEALKGKTGAGESIDYRGVHILCAYRYAPVLEWGVVVKIDKEEAHASIYAARNATITVILITAVAVVLLSLFIARLVATPILKLSNWAEQVALGDLTPQQITTSKDEIGVVSRSFRTVVDSLSRIAVVANSAAEGDFTESVEIRSDRDRLGQAIDKMIQNLRKVVTQARAIAGGDYSTRIQPLSDKDELGKALIDMTGTLRQVTTENERQDWLKSSQADLNDCIRGEQDVISLGRNVITTLTKLLDMQIGALYHIDEGERLKLSASYAYTERKNLSNEFKLGEGLVGQAALERECIQLTNVPDDYVKIVSALGDTVPKHIVTLPFEHEGTVQGVIELGSIKEVTELQMNLLMTVRESIAIAFNFAKSRARLQELLEESQRQSEELQTQSEELQTQSEELQSQAQELQTTNEELEEKSEKLKQQTEELQATNEELEERSEELREQKSDVDRRNIELEATRTELEEKASDLQLASKYKSEFLANMSHELRTPLNSLLILAQNMAENKAGNLDEDQIESANIIKSSGEDLLNLINEILDLSKVEAGKLDIQIKEVDLKSIAETMRGQFEPVASSQKLDFAIEIAEDAPQGLKTDRMRLEQILKNLLSNSFKFTKEGSVRLSIHRPDADVRFRHSALSPSNTICFSIIDTGIGIPQEKQKTIFEAFQQADGSTSRHFGGTGLGLTVSRELARLLGGEIHLQSQRGKGSTFSLFLPFSLELDDREHDEESALIHALDETTEEVQTEAVNDKASPKYGPEFIPDDRMTISKGDKVTLVIEDDPTFAGVLTNLAREKGYKVLAAGDARSGLQLAAAFIPSAIMLDLGLPDLDGLLVLDNLKQNLKTRHIPVHVVSGLEKKAASLEKGAVGFLTKPCRSEDIEGVFAKIEKLLQSNIKHLLVVEDEEKARQAIRKLFAHKDINITEAASGQEALEQLNLMSFDCVILDLSLGDMTGFDLLRTLRDSDSIQTPPVIVYTGKELTREEHKELSEYAEGIVIKGASSPERLLDEVSLFLHSVETSLPPDQRKIIRMLHDTDQPLQGKKILMVDDDLRNTFALSKVLKQHGLVVTLADNGQMALDRLEEDPNMDLIIMDIMMPVMDGYEAMQEIRQQSRFEDLPIIALTAKAMAADRTKCLESGASDYLTKPVDIEKLLSMMRVWLFQPQAKSVVQV